MSAERARQQAGQPRSPSSSGGCGIRGVSLAERFRERCEDEQTWLDRSRMFTKMYGPIANLIEAAEELRDLLQAMEKRDLLALNREGQRTIIDALSNPLAVVAAELEKT